MKKFAKLIPVALGLLTLASCSNDDFFGESAANKMSQYGEGWLIVHDENLTGDNDNYFTRSYRSTDMTERLWVNTDEMRVYDKDLHKYDIFTYQNGDPGEYSAFRLKTTRQDAEHKAIMNIDKAEYALYPKEDVISGHWDYNEETGQTRTTAQVRIPGTMIYSGTNKATYKDDGTLDKYVPVFKDVLPQWGAVETTDQGYLETHLSYLTGVLRLRLNGTPKYAKALKVMMYDKNGMVPLNMNGQYTLTLATNDIPDVPDTDADGKFIAGTGAQINTLGPTDFCGDGSIVIDMTKAAHDFDDINQEFAKRSTLWVPLVCTPDRQVDIVVYAWDPVDDGGIIPFPPVPGDYSPYDPCATENWKEIMRFEDKTIVRGKVYGNPAEYNLAVGGYDPNSINDALETAEPDDDGIIRLETENPIGVCNEGGDNTILIPNKEDTKLIILNLTQGLEGCGPDQTLYIKYKDNNDKFEGDVLLITPTTSDEKDVNITTMIDKSGFGLAGRKFKKLAIDADEFVAGEGKIHTLISGENIQYSDNIKKLTVEKNAIVEYPTGSDYCTLVVADEVKNLEEVNIYGFFMGGIDAHESEVDINVTGEGSPAVFAGGSRTQGGINVSGKGILVTNEDMCTPGFAAFEDINISGQSFAVGSLFTKNGDIIINNVDLNQFDYFTDGGGKLSDLIYETFDLGDALMPSFDEISYGPLYAEGTDGGGSIKVSAVNSKLVINNELAPEEIKGMLNEHAQKAVGFTVYAQKDIEFSGEETEINGKMWAENDVRLSGKTRAKDHIYADNDFSIIENSSAQNVYVGHNATVNVAEQDGQCIALQNLAFAKNDLGNALSLEQGYIKQVLNGGSSIEGYETPADVQLIFSTEPAYAAIGTVTYPTKLIPQNESKWNGKQMPAELVAEYIGSDPFIYTATELAYQTVEPTTQQIMLLSDINLMDEKWNGINSLSGGPSDNSVNTFFTKKQVSNVNLRGHGFFNYLIGGEVYGLKLNKVKSTAQVYDRIINVVKEDPDFNPEYLPYLTFALGESTPGAVGALVGYASGEEDTPVSISNVTVVLSGNLGSDGVHNKEACFIGGLIGLSSGDVTLRGVRVNAKNGSLGGYAYIGGLIGGANVTESGNVVIDDAGLLEIDLPEGMAAFIPGADEDGVFKLDAATTKVGNLKVNVTYSMANPPYTVNDVYQGTTGLYIGGADISDSESIYLINVKGNKAFDESNFTVTGAQENLAFVNADDSKAYKFERSTAQNLIGNCGFERSQSTIKIGSDFYEVKKGMDESSATPGYKPLYFLRYVGLVPGGF